MQQWEYRVATLEPGDDAVTRLNILGAEGWELIQVIGNAPLSNAVAQIGVSVLYLKRPKTNQEKK